MNRVVISVSGCVVLMMLSMITENRKCIYSKVNECHRCSVEHDKI